MDYHKQLLVTIEYSVLTWQFPAIHEVRRLERKPRLQGHIVAMELHGHCGMGGSAQAGMRGSDPASGITIYRTKTFILFGFSREFP